MPRGDFFGSRNMGLPLRARPSPSRSISILDRGRTLSPEPKPQVWTPMQAAKAKGKSIVRHAEYGTPMGYSFPFEAHVAYVKDGWCQPSCMCLHHAVAAGDISKVEAAASGLSPYTRKHGLNQLDESGRTPIMIAAWRGHQDIVTWLMDKGADLNVQDNEGRSVMHWAASTEEAAPHILETLSHGNIEPLVKDRHGETVMHKCVQKNLPKAAEILSKAYPRLCLVKDTHGRRPMDLIRKPNARLKQAVDIVIAMEYVKEEQRRLMLKITEEEELAKKQKIAQQLREADALARKRREAIIKRSGLGGEGSSYMNVGQLDSKVEGSEEQEDELGREAKDDKFESLHEPEHISFFNALVGTDDKEEDLPSDDAVNLAADALGRRRKSVSRYSTERGARRRGMMINEPIVSPDMLKALGGVI